MSSSYFLHDGLVFYTYESYREHFETCPVCKLNYDAEKTAAKQFGERVFSKIHSSILSRFSGECVD